MDYPPTINSKEKKDSEDNNHEIKNDSWLNTYIFNNEKFKIPKTTFPRPFLIQTNEKQYGILTQDRLYFTDPEDFEKVKDAFYKYEWLIGEMDARTNNNKHYDPTYVDYIGETLGTMNEIFNKSKKISPAFISEKNNEENPERFYEEFQNYLILLEEVNKEKIEDYFNLKFEDLSMREQFYFLNFIKDKNEEEIAPVKNLTDKFGTDAFRTFLSIEQGGKEMGDKIISLGEKLPEDAARKLFGKYSEYIDAVNSVEEVINKEYKLPPSPKLINKTKESLLIRGRDLLLSQNKKLLDGQFSEEKFITSLENTKVGVDLFKNIFRIVKENNPDTSFEDFFGLVPEQINSRDQITDKDILTIDKIIDKNYANDELRNAVKNSFHKAIESNSTVLNLLRKNEEIIALDRIDHKEDGSLYFGSFNVDPDYCSSKIGAAFFEATVVPLMKDKIVKADCSAIQPIASYYIESGFVASSLYDYNSEPSFSLESVPGEKLISKDLTKSQIIESLIKNENIDGLIIKSAPSQKEIAEQKIPEGYSLTRYFFDKNTSKWFVVFEKTN